MKRICLISILICTATVLSAQSVWTGNAAVSTDREFESYYSEDSSTGEYLGASNSFPGSTEVTVTNPRNGKSVSVSIVKRLSQPGLFLVLSPEAGEAIALPDDDILNVEVVVRRKNEDVFSKYTEDQPYSKDPDLNPSAELSMETTENRDLPDSESPFRADPETELEMEPPVAGTINEYIPPVVLSDEKVLYEEGYDPLVILESEEEHNPEREEIVEIVDDPLALAEAITGPITEPEVPLPDRYDDSDLPESFEAEDRPGETGSNENISEDSLVLSEPAVIESEELDTDFMDTDIDDILISEKEEAEPQTEKPETEEPESKVPETEIADNANPEAEDREISEIVPDESEIQIDNFDEFVIAEPLFEAPDAEEAEIPEAVIEEFLVPEPEESEALVIESVEEIEPIVLIPDSEVVITEEEPAGETTLSEEPEKTGNIIYFLTPGDFRPPPQSEEKKEKEKEKLKEKSIVALPVERTELNNMIVSELRNGSSYLQLGTYSSADVLYSRINRISDAYPSIVLTVGDVNNQLYKLLIGPLSRDERGVVIARFRSLGFNDAFLYTPR